MIWGAVGTRMESRVEKVERDLIEVRDSIEVLLSFVEDVKTHMMKGTHRKGPKVDGLISKMGL